MTASQAIVITLAIGALPLATLAATEAVYPGKTWARKTPAEVGLVPAKLQDFSRYVRGRGCVVRGGQMAYTWGNYKRRGDVASAAKPVYAHFQFKAFEDGKIPSLDERVVRWEPRLRDINKNLGGKDAWFPISFSRTTAPGRAMTTPGTTAR